MDMQNYLYVCIFAHINSIARDTRSTIGKITTLSYADILPPPHRSPSLAPEAT